MKEWYDNLDGLRAISCLSIIAMHIKANADYNFGIIDGQIVDSWTQFVPLFLIITGFGMFCGYYDKFQNGSIDLNTFYSKRYGKLLPFFITLILLDIVMDRSSAHVIEGITEATLVFGLLPNNQPEVIGVCWTLGVIFLFYMLFPFVVYLCWNKKRAWCTFAVSIVMSLFCSLYFFTDKFVVEDFAARHNFLYCAPFFMGGGIMYLNRGEIKNFVQKFRWLWLVVCICLTALWYWISGEIVGIDVTMLKNLVLFMAWLMYAISVKSRVLNNKKVKYLSGISLELYLAQMVIFRVIEKVHGLYLFGHGRISFIATVLMVIAGLIIYIKIWKTIWNLIRGYSDKLSKKLC